MLVETEASTYVILTNPSYANFRFIKNPLIILISKLYAYVFHQKQANWNWVLYCCGLNVCVPSPRPPDKFSVEILMPTVIVREGGALG